MPQKLKPKISGVYLITCVPTQKAYVGSSADTRRRWECGHRKELRRGVHRNQYLQRTWNKYGENNFTFEVIELVEQARLLIREQYWMDRLKSYESANGFNGTHKSTLSNYQHTPEQRARAVQKRSKTWIVRTPDGDESTIINLRQFCKDNKLDVATMVKVAQGLWRHHKEWECRYAGQTRSEWLKTLKAPTRRMRPTETQKWCPTCQKYKNFDAFTTDITTKTGLSAYCGKCDSERAMTYTAKNRERTNANARKSYHARQARKRQAEHEEP